MHKRERLECAIAGESVDRAPVALWRHWPGDDQRFADLARSTIDFQKDFDWDFVRVMPARHYQVLDYGVQDEWRGHARGYREISKRAIQRSLGWTEIRPLTPTRGALAQQLECLRILSQAFDAEKVPVLPTVYSPFDQAIQMAGRDKVLRDMRLRADRLRTGLNHLTESTLRFLEALHKLPAIAGIFLVTEAATYELMSEQEFAAAALPDIARIVASLPDHWWLNIVHVSGRSPMLRLFARLPVQALNWDTRAGDADLASAKAFFSGALCGGLSDHDDLLQGTPALLRSVVRDALRQTESRRFIVSGSGPGYITAPRSNLRAARASVDAQV